MPISEELLKILCCPQCKGDIRLSDTGDGLTCDACKLLYPIKDDIPIMIIEEALPLNAPGSK
ncbi:MAG TPA: Trm112 family protein [Syntrophorhabdaceae bacterium]|nr:Trm112 family protein [Syntrophorhabdaceae bacterium]